MLTITCEHCGRSVTRPRGDEGRGRFCSIKCGRAAQVMPTLEHRFWAKVAKGDGCWEWTGAKHSTMGHGVLRLGTRTVHHQQFAHRLSWELHNGPIPDGLWVLHHCDNPPCVRPDHLYVGTPADNVRDRDTRGRQKTRRGEANGRAHTDEATIRLLRTRVAAGEQIVRVARDLGLTPATAYQAVSGRSWKHLL